MQASTAAGVMRESMEVLPTEGQTPPHGCRWVKCFETRKLHQFRDASRPSGQTAELEMGFGRGLLEMERFEETRVFGVQVFTT